MLKKIPYQDPQNILRLYSPSEPFLLLATQNILPSALIELAMSHALFSDTVIFLAHGLPIREAIWWATCCASTIDDWDEKQNDAIRAAKAWSHAPDESTRRHAGAMATIAGLESGAGWAAQAAFWSGGSMIKPEDPIVPPPPHLYAQAVAGSVNLCAVLPPGKKPEARYMDFINMGLDIARGGNGKI